MLKILPIMLQIMPQICLLCSNCPLFLKGANLYVQIIALLCCVRVQHHNFITKLKPGLGA